MRLFKALRELRELQAFRVRYGDQELSPHDSVHVQIAKRRLWADAARRGQRHE